MGLTLFEHVIAVELPLDYTPQFCSALHYTTLHYTIHQSPLHYKKHLKTRSTSLRPAKLTLSIACIIIIYRTRESHLGSEKMRIMRAKSEIGLKTIKDEM